MNNNIYQQFAKYYAEGQYSQFADQMSEQFSALQERYDLPINGKLLDIACGNGAFAIEMACQGWQVCGIDGSLGQLEIAKLRLAKSGQSVDFQQADMRELDFSGEFDLATCWFDSLNYMLTPEDLSAAFQAAYQSLKPGGFYVFDMNTIFGIMVRWQRQGTAIESSSPTLLEIHRNSCDHENNIAQLHITIFERDKEMIAGEYRWKRMDEIHTERAYPVVDIRTWLEEVGFTVVDTLGSLEEFLEPRKDSPRVWFVAKK